MTDNGSTTETRPGTALVPAMPAPPRPAARWTAVRNLEEAVALGQLIHQSNTFPDVTNAAKAVVKILAGSEMGFGPFASLCDVHFIEGKASLGAHLRAAAIKGSDRYDYDVCRADGEVCDLEFFEWTGSGGATRKGRAGWTSRGHVSYTLKEATESGLAIGKDGRSLKANWKRNPDDMLFARVVSKGYRRHCPDLSGGVLAYAPEELDVDDAEVVTTSTTPAPPPAQEQSAPKTEPPAASACPAPGIRPEQEERLAALMGELGITVDQLAQWLVKAFGSGDWTKLSEEQADRVITGLEAKKAKEGAAQPAGAKS
jgi:hypothetical protein